MITFLLEALGELLEDFAGDFVLLKLLAALGLADQGVVAILDHMLSSGFIKEGDEFGPPLPIFKDVAEDKVIFRCCPLPPLLVRVQVVEPPLAAVFGSPEDPPFGAKEHPLGDFVPLSGFFSLHALHQEVIFLLCPRDPLLELEKVEILKMQKLRLLMEEERREVVPGVLGLS